MDRRTYLKSAGAVLGSCVLASTGAAAIEYERTVNIVEAGADPTGSQPIDDVFQRVAQDGTLVKFPEGEYLVNHLSLYSLSNFGMRAVGDATLVPGANYDTDTWIGGAETENLLIEGFTIDTTSDGVSPTVTISSYGGLIVRDVLKRGPQNDGSTAFSFRIVDPNGVGLVENLRIPDGDTDGNSVGIYTNTDGTLTVRDCHIEGFGNNGLYGSGSDGPVQVEGGLYRNNNVTSIRLGSPGSYVKSADVVVSDPRFDDGNYRGIRISDGPGPVTIEDVDIRLESGQGTGGVVAAFDGGSFDLRNSRIHVSPDYTIVGADQTTGHAVYVDDASGIGDPGERTIQNLSVTGGGNDYPAIEFNRDNNTVEGAQIHQDGNDRDGIHVASGSANNTVRNCAIEVTGQQVVDDGGVHVANLADDANPANIEISLGGDGGSRSRPESDGGTTTETKAETTETTQTETQTPTQTETATQTQTETTTQTTTTESETTQTETATSTQTETPTQTATETQTTTQTPAETSAPVQTETPTQTESDAGSKRAAYPVTSPGDSTYATMATTDDAPTATVWGSFRCPYSAKFVSNNFRAIVDELVRSGDLRLRHRTLPYDFDDPEFPGIEDAKGGVLAAEYGLGVWEVDPDRYWTFYDHVFQNQPDGRWVTADAMDAFMREAGVQNRDGVHARVEDGRYHSAVKRTTKRANELGITLVPRISFRGDTIPARRDTEVVLGWLRDRL